MIDQFISLFSILFPAFLAFMLFLIIRSKLGVSEAEKNYRGAVVSYLVANGIPEAIAAAKVASFHSAMELRQWQADGCFMEVDGVIWAHGKPTKLKVTP